MRALIAEKAKGKRIVAKPSLSEPQGKVVDLLDALRKSLKTSGADAPKRARTPQKKASETSSPARRERRGPQRSWGR